MKHGNPESAAYQKILTTAQDLFYRHGYRATGINEIIKKSGVAKATFYAHFPSKESLALAYVKAMNEQETREFNQGIQKYEGPYEKLIGIIKYAGKWSEERGHRGCTYLNMSSEMLDPTSAVRLEGKLHYDGVWELARTLLKELKQKKGAAWKNRDPEKMADSYFLIFTGAMALAQVYHEKEPFQNALEAIKRLLD